MKNVMIMALLILATITNPVEAKLNELLAYTNCSDHVGDVPFCEKVGTRSEGWYLNGELVTNWTGEPAYDFCADKMVYCGAKGTRSEGWYIFDFMNIPIEFNKSNNDCSIDCAEQAKDFCTDHPVSGAVCYGTAFVACMAGCY